MNKGLYLVTLLDELCIFITAVLFFGGWFVLGKDSRLTIISGFLMFVSMFGWFVIAALEQFFSISDEGEFYEDIEIGEF